VQPVAFSFDWDDIRLRIIDGLRYTLHWRYVQCYGPASYQMRRREMEEATEMVDRPPKRRRV
jgi:hypothetical protein